MSTWIDAGLQDRGKYIQCKISLRFRHLHAVDRLDTIDNGVLTLHLTPCCGLVFFGNILNLATDDSARARTVCYPSNASSPPSVITIREKKINEQPYTP